MLYIINKKNIHKNIEINKKVSLNVIFFFIFMNYIYISRFYR